MKKKSVVILFIIGAIILAYTMANHMNQIGNIPKNTGFSKSQYSLSDPSSIWVLVNKHRPLAPKTYAPTDLVVPNIKMRANITDTERQVRQVTATALQKMFTDASKQGILFDLQSGYRSYAFQETLYSGYVAQQGQATADTQSARPGYSEHQTGLAADLGSVNHPECDIADCFRNTTEGQWLAANSYRYGFIIRYTSGNQSVTGYIPEPWHVRYVGIALASQMHTQHIATLEEFFGTGAAPDYN